MHRVPCTMHRMATQKRRVIYLSDDVWEATLAEAERGGVTASALIRDCLLRGHLRHRTDMKPEGVIDTTEQLARTDAFIARAIEDAARSRPFTPVPKPGKRK